MLRPDENRDRIDYNKLLLPPNGYKLVFGIGTTYSLDLNALISVAISLGLLDESENTNNPIVMLNGISRITDKLLIFCEAGQTRKSADLGVLSLMLERMIVPVALPKNKSGHYPAFHPKCWILHYQNDKKEDLYRFAVLSRNLTFDRSWDIAASFDGYPCEEENANGIRLSHFVSFLQKQLTNDSPYFKENKRKLNRIINALPRIAFKADDKQFKDGLMIIPMGPFKGSHDFRTSYLLCNDKTSQHHTFHELVVFSPFLSASVIDDFNKDSRTLTGTTRTLITRRSELPKLRESQISNFDIYVMKEDIVDGESKISDDGEQNIKEQDIHAKMYLRRKYDRSALYFGSMNASHYAITENVEMMVALYTRYYLLNGEKLLNDFFCGPADGPQNPFEKIDKLPDEEIDTTEKDALEVMIKDFCRLNARAVVYPKDDLFDVIIHIENELPRGNITISPIRRNMPKTIDKEVKFESLDLLSLSSFYEIEARGEDTVIRRIIMIPTEGIPVFRDNEIVKSIVHDKATFAEYISFVLEDSVIMQSLENAATKQTQAKKNADASKEIYIPALYEKMLKIAYEDKERISQIGYLLSMLDDSSVVPKEFTQMYETFVKTLKL